MRLDEFLRFNDRNVLPNAGKVSREEADQKALAEYKQFAARREHLEAEALRELEERAKRLPKVGRPDESDEA